MKLKPSSQTEQKPSPERSGRRVQVALPLKVTCWDGDYKPCLDMACTYDISPRGARITGLRGAKEIGDIIAIERGRNKLFCRVVWVGRPDSEFRGQVGIENVETERSMWDAELRDLKEIYDPVVRESNFRHSRLTAGERNRRRSPRYSIEGAAELSSSILQGRTAQGVLKDLSEVGCLLSTNQSFPRGTELTLNLSVANYEFGLKALVRHIDPAAGMGLEFREIRKGDRQTLRFLLGKLAEQELEQSFELEIAEAASSR
ncbi:MAG TPA: PilZ domain-containing protein [Terriglobales bacterium]|nr:PilZ domain-containing protein [Terriglobales bacterium]